ncbi:MAG: hypothetical protein ACD_39C00628G0001 [uncultured bacterium]|nr:MAG: hypothetical protein ACD_39C00628G0001 [uncultured bacterium]
MVVFDPRSDEESAQVAAQLLFKLLFIVDFNTAFFGDDIAQNQRFFGINTFFFSRKGFEPVKQSDLSGCDN